MEKVFSDSAYEAKFGIPRTFFLQHSTNMTITVFVSLKCYLINFDTKAIKNLQLKLTTAVCSTAATAPVRNLLEQQLQILSILWPNGAGTVEF